MTNGGTRLLPQWAREVSWDLNWTEHDLHVDKSVLHRCPLSTTYTKSEADNLGRMPLD